MAGQFIRSRRISATAATWSGNLVDLTVGNGGAGLVLLGGDGSPGLELSPARKFVFVHLARIASKNQAEHGIAP